MRRNAYIGNWIEAALEAGWEIEISADGEVSVFNAYKVLWSKRRHGDIFVALEQLSKEMGLAVACSGARPLKTTKRKKP